MSDPTRQELVAQVKGEPNLLLEEFCSYVENTFSPKTQVDFSGCSAAPGWNFKYKKSGKSVCTVYPDESHATVLITMNAILADLYDGVKGDFTSYFQDLIERSSGMNGSKWLMIELTNRDVLQDIQKLLELKYGAKK